MSNVLTFGCESGVLVRSVSHSYFQDCIYMLGGSESECCFCDNEVVNQVSSVLLCEVGCP